jgi:hypothetical protein
MYDVNLRTKACSAYNFVTVLDGHERHVVFALTRYTALGGGVNQDFAIAGSLPLQGLSVQLTRFGAYYPVAIDGTAYYANNLTPGHYTLQVREAQVFSPIEIPIYVPLSSTTLIIRNVTLDEIRRK